MNALLLSAGEGVRLRPLTLETPKCLLPLIKDEPILKYWIDTLIGAEIDEIYVNVYWLKDKIKEYVNGLSQDIKSKVFLYEETTRLEPVGEVLAKLNCCLGEEFLVINSDTYIERNEVYKFVKLAKIYRQPETPICLAVERREDTKGKGVVSFFSDQEKRIKDFVEKPENNLPGYVWAGMALMGREVIESYDTEELTRKELSRDIFPDFRGRMIGLEVKEATDIGSNLEAYRGARRMLNRITGEFGLES